MQFCLLESLPLGCDPPLFFSLVENGPAEWRGERRASGACPPAPRVEFRRLCDAQETAQRRSILDISQHCSSDSLPVPGMRALGTSFRRSAAAMLRGGSLLRTLLATHSLGKQSHTITTRVPSHAVLHLSPLLKPELLAQLLCLSFQVESLTPLRLLHAALHHAVKRSSTCP